MFRVEESGVFAQMSDVYSFGVFLLELVTGQEASHIVSLGSYEALIQWVCKVTRIFYFIFMLMFKSRITNDVSYNMKVRSRLSVNDFVDHRLAGTFTTDGMRDLIRLTLQCMSSPGKRRPKIEMVMLELERIHENEMALTTFMGEGTATIILGSELFT